MCMLPFHHDSKCIYHSTTHYKMLDDNQWICNVRNTLPAERDSHGRRKGQQMLFLIQIMIEN